MPDITPTTEYTAIAIIVIFLIKEMFSYLKSRKSNGTNGKMLTELKAMNENHLNSIRTEIIRGNKEIVEAINRMSSSVGDKIDGVEKGVSRLIGRSDKL